MERQRKRGYRAYPLAPVPQVHTSPLAVTAAVCASPQSTCVIADEKSVSTNSGFHFCCLSPPPSYKWNVGTRWADSVLETKRGNERCRGGMQTKEYKWETKETTCPLAPPPQAQSDPSLATVLAGIAKQISPICCCY